MKMNLPVSNHEYVLADDDVIVTHTDLSSRITYASDAFVRSSGYSRQETIGQPQNMVRHPDMPEAAFADLWQTIQAGKPWTGLVKNSGKNRDFYWVRANVTPFVKGGKSVGYMSVRVKPTRQEIETASALYASMREGRASNTKLSGG